jgi:hypothetical protein
VLRFPATPRASPLRGSVPILGMIPSLAVLRRSRHDRLVTRNGRWPRRVALAGGRREEADDLHGSERNAVSFARGSHLWAESPGFEVRVARVAQGRPWAPGHLRALGLANVSVKAGQAQTSALDEPTIQCFT